MPLWFILTMVVAVGANALAGATTGVTIALMRGATPFALEVRAHDLRVLPFFTPIAYAIPGTIILSYLWPVVRFFRSGMTAPDDLVKRRVVSAPLFVAAMGFAPWIFGIFTFPLVTVIHFGRWSGDLASQQIWSPIVNGYLAASVTYFLVDWVFRSMVVPVVFPAGRLVDVSRAWALGVRGRLLVYLIAVAFVPMFTLLGLVRAAAERIAVGQPMDAVLEKLVFASGTTFAVYLLLGLGLTWVLARTLTRPLGDMAGALRRVQAGTLDAGVAVRSSDEVGALEDGVNDLVAALRDRERILTMFGRIVEPAVRDQLLSGTLPVGGELRRASVLFCDLRGFTALAEEKSPTEVVATLNDFFTAMTTWVRTCGGFVDKFIGDAMLVVFGLFGDDVGQEDAAAAAVRCALGMRSRLGTLNETRAANGDPPLALKVGIHTGEVVAGTIGATDRHEFTVIGDTVNVAFRLQQLAKEHGQDVLVSETTYRLASACDSAPAVSMSDSVVLRGRQEPVRVFALA